ncbi:hypothetical protein HYV73_02585 [Candidatus Uhrbacteria bacterium]|nr:hypothetical protein [Candidatus Uhrbacteria bacterium]
MAVARVYPHKRLPRRFSFFDYSIPDGMVVRRGSAVRIPWRGGFCDGFVQEVVMETDIEKIRPIEAVHPFFLSVEEIALMERIAKETVQSVASVLHALIPSTPKRGSQSSRAVVTAGHPLTMRPAEAEELRLMKAQAQYVAACLLKDRKAIMLLLVPTVREADLLQGTLKAFHPLVVSGAMTKPHRFSAWSRWRKEGRLLIGTHTACAYLPSRVTDIVLVDVGNHDHKQTDQNPRFDARRVASWFRSLRPIRLHRLDTIPSHRFLVPTATPVTLLSSRLPPPRIISLTRSFTASPSPFITPELMEGLNETFENGRKALLILDRKGAYSLLRCDACGWTATCAEHSIPLQVVDGALKCARPVHAQAPPYISREGGVGVVIREPMLIPDACPKCKSPKLRGRGRGIATVATALARLYPDVRIHSYEKGKLIDDSADLWISTRHYLDAVWDPFLPPAFHLVALLCADLSLVREGSMLEAWRTVSQAQAVAADTSLMIQTFQPGIFGRLFEKPDVWIAEELRARKLLHQPPFLRHAEIRSRTSVSSQEATSILEGIRDHVPSAHIDVTASAIGVSLPPDAIDHFLAFASTLPDSLTVDSDVFS